MNRTKSHQSEGLGESTSGHAGPKCNECNKVTARLARVAKNALLNGDFPRVIAILDRLSDAPNEIEEIPHGALPIEPLNQRG
jgi:hypothetical protein